MCSPPASIFSTAFTFLAAAIWARFANGTETTVRRTSGFLRQRSCFQSNPLETIGRLLEHCQQHFRLARNLHFPNDLADVVHNADAGFLDRNVQSSKMVHAALLLLMLEAVHGPRFTISLKRSTQNLLLSTSSPADYPIFRTEADMNRLARPAASV